MRVYSSEVESNIHLERQVREWTQSGILSATQGTMLRETIRVDLKRTNVFLRVVLFIFSFVIAVAAVVLIAELSHLDDKTAGVLCIMGGAVAFLIADVLARKLQLYRFGVEEGFAIISVLLVSVGVGLTAGFNIFGYGSRIPLIIGFGSATLLSLVAYMRFGYIYAAALGLIGLYSMSFEITETMTEKIALAAALQIAVVVIARALRRRCDKEYLFEEFGAIETLAFIGAYLVLNVQLGILPGLYSPTLRQPLPFAFYWFTYASVWILPIVGFVLSLREKHRELILASVGMALATLVTNKPYLGREQQTWDAILFGLFLIGVALAVKRWLASGLAGNRYGFTAARLLQSDRQIMTVIGTASAALPISKVGITAHADSDRSLHTRGGYSGGAGATGDF